MIEGSRTPDTTERGARGQCIRVACQYASDTRLKNSLMINGSPSASAHVRACDKRMFLL